MVAACDVRGGAVGERELETLRPGHLVERIHALVLAGGNKDGLFTRLAAAAKVPVIEAADYREVVARNCGFDGDCDDEAIGPVVIPSIGFEGRL